MGPVLRPVRVSRWVWSVGIGVNPVTDFDVAAPVDAWREYDVDNPDPFYYQFDSLSARHPDLYHAFALSTVGLMEELAKLVDLTGLIVVDVGAGTGRSTHAAARVAQKVYAVDAYPTVLEFNEREAARLGLDNIEYLVADRSTIPLDDSSVDAVIAAWADPDPFEAMRILRPGGLLVHMHRPDEWFAGELTPVLLGGGPTIDVDVAPVDWVLDGEVNVHDFPYVATYESVDEAVAVHGRLIGPAAADYLRNRNQQTMASILRIYWMRIP